MAWPRESACPLACSFRRGGHGLGNRDARARWRGEFAVSLLGAARSSARGAAGNHWGSGEERVREVRGRVAGMVGCQGLPPDSGLAGRLNA